MKFAFIATSLVSTWVFGFELGAYFNAKRTQKQLDAITPMMATAFVNVYQKTQDEGLSEREVTELLQAEMEFIKIAVTES